MKRCLIPAVVPAALSCLLAACTSDLPSGPPDPEQVVVGTVTEIADLVPVDGGVTLWLRLDDGSSETLEFPSLFTEPPPDQEILDLYEIVRRVEVGDRVWASGRRIEDDGIALTDLRILG